MNVRTRFVIGVCAMAVGAVFPAYSAAAPIADLQFLEMPLSGGAYQYDYTLFNKGELPGDAGYDIFDVTLFFNAGTITSTAVPSDWDAISGPGFVEAFSLVPGPLPAGADVGPGSFLPGFTFVFDRQVGPISFAVLFTNPLDPLNPVLVEGTTREVPNRPVPEPPLALLIVTTLAAVLASRIRGELSFRRRCPSTGYRP